MKTIKYDCIEYHYREKPQYDFDGKLLPLSKTYNHLIQFPLELFVDSDKIKILVEAEISKKFVPSIKDHIDYLFTEIRKNIEYQFSQMNKLEIFKAHYISVYGSDVAEYKQNKFYSTNKNRQPIDILVKDSFYNQIQVDFMEYRTILGIIKNVIDKVKSYGFDFSPTKASEILNLVNFLIYCNECSWNDFTHNTHEAFYSIKDDIMQLAKRKRENNSTYQSLLRDLKKFCMLISVPNIWEEKPIIPINILNKYK